MKLFVAKANEFDNTWLSQQDDKVSEEKRLKFSKQWIKKWMKEYGVSLRKPNKRFATSKAERKIRIIGFLKNVWRVHYWFRSRFGQENPIINVDQMPLHRNESAVQKTFSFRGETTFVRGNYMISQERITVFTQVSSDKSNPLPVPEFVFKGKGT